MHGALLSIPSPSINELQLGSVTIRYYALFILVGIVLGLWLTAVRLKQRGVKPGVAIDIAIWAVPFGIIGGRVYHVLTHLNDYFAPEVDWTTVFHIWEGGLAIYGAIIFGALGAFIGAKMSGIKFLAFADALAPGILLAQAIGRWGNYFNVELFGVPTTLPWGLEVPQNNPAYPTGLPAGVLFHPTFLYESLWDLLGVFVLIWIGSKFNLQWGKLFATYLVYYSVGRAFIESIRIDPAAVVLGLRTNVWSAILGIAVGVFLFWYQSRKHPGLEESPFIAAAEVESIDQALAEAPDEAPYQLESDKKK